MPFDAARIAETREWLTKAQIDLRAADHDRTAEPPITADMVFHAQQVVEKMLKAFLCWHDVPFRKTHNLVELGERCADIEEIAEPLLRKAAVLTEYAWKFRYPGDAEEPEIAEADEAVALARAVNQAVLNCLPDDLCP
ncbi:MAG: DNA-binding protein [Candidatus Anoxymicrobium japonicum]|uniref:DNA-binding protein n=1 Tax=Candidatus Anoxymicrobium japonicum TaxID=2013648 RepID=A0A2N3G6Z0_9ACTN|nr:MAG: DNA-binding protein [Candidatus Anoxymicrobium japonicum]